MEGTVSLTIKVAPMNRVWNISEDKLIIVHYMSNLPKQKRVVCFLIVHHLVLLNFENGTNLLMPNRSTLNAWSTVFFGKVYSGSN